MSALSANAGRRYDNADGNVSDPTYYINIYINISGLTTYVLPSLLTHYCYTFKY